MASVTAVADLDGILRSLHLTATGTDRYSADNVEAAHGVVFGGQLLGQAMVAALIGVEGKRVKTVHTVFSRAGSPDAPLDVTVERIHEGRALASSVVTISQNDRVCTKL